MSYCSQHDSFYSSYFILHHFQNFQKCKFQIKNVQLLTLNMNKLTNYYKIICQKLNRKQDEAKLY